MAKRGRRYQGHGIRVHPMSFIIVTIAILMLLGINLWQHGQGCWGAQPGGGLSSLLYLLQLVAAAWALAFGGLRLLKHKPPSWVVGIILLGVCGLSSVYLLLNQGHIMWTTVHHQGLENLTPFIMASLTACVGGLLASSAESTT